MLLKIFVKNYIFEFRIGFKVNIHVNVLVKSFTEKISYTKYCFFLESLPNIST